MTLLAIHAGTTGVTAVVVSEAGDVVATGSQDLARHVPQPGWVEHAPEEIWQAMLGATRRVLTQVDPSALGGIGITHQPGTVVLWDRETLGSPRRAIGRQDRRTVETCARLRAVGHEGRVAELTGLPLGPGSSAPTLAWIAEHEPRTWALVDDGSYAVGDLGSYLVARMTRGLEHVTDVGSAHGTLLLDLATADWSDELCAVFGVPRDALPELVPTWGELAVTDSRSFHGLELPVAALAGEPAAVLVAQGCLDAGEVAFTLGARASVVTTTGTSLERSDAALLTTLAWRSPSGELAYALAGAVPGSDAAAEAVAVGVREVLEAMPGTPTSLRVDAGSGSTDLLCRALADRTGVPVLRSRCIDTAALGAAHLAGLATGVWSSVDDLRAIWPLDRRFDPSVHAR